MSSLTTSPPPYTTSDSDDAFPHKFNDMKRLMDRHDSGVVVGFHVENKTSYRLTDTFVHMKGGAMEVPFTDMAPQSSKMFVATKNNTPTGCYGTVSWKISPKSGYPRRVVVMWCAPYNRILYDNYLAVGISDAYSNPDDRDWFKTMYGNVAGREERKWKKNYISYHRNNFSKITKQVEVSEGGICMDGTMGSHNKAQVFITIREK